MTLHIFTLLQSAFFRGNLRQAPNVLLICSVLVTYLLFVAVCIIIIKYAYQGYGKYTLEKPLC